jgi:hypothetical protein
MGDKRELTRALGLGYVIIIVISNIIGSGVFKKIAPMAAELHSSLWILLVWLAAGMYLPHHCSCRGYGHLSWFCRAHLTS